MVRAPRTNAGQSEFRGEAREKRLGLIRAFARDEDVDAIVLYFADCADGSCQVDAQDSFASASDIGD
jgi:hypothetical protein